MIEGKPILEVQRIIEEDHRCMFCYPHYEARDLWCCTRMGMMETGIPHMFGIPCTPHDWENCPFKKS